MKKKQVATQDKRQPTVLNRVFPFLAWFEGYKFPHFRADFLAGVTVALVLIPQSMAYAQLAGLPAYYGLYAAFLPPMIAALFGSSRQLATGPVAIVSLMTAASLEPLATAGSEAFIAYAVVMALVVGVFQLGLGLLRLGVIVNFLSHPVVNGFTNAVAMIISLLGFMEAISIAKAMAAKTGQRLDPNQELIGQGLANILGSFGQSYPVSGSFSRSAVNLGAGAVTGLSSVFTSLVVVATLLLFTPLLYFIPQPVLAAVIMMAVIGLVNVRGFIHAYKAQRHDGIIAVISFFCTLGLAPHLDRGILIGVVLTIGHYLFRNSRPVLASLALHPDYSFRDARRHGLRRCQHLAVIRFHGPLFFANASYLEDRITAEIEQLPGLRHIVLAAHGINEIDATGEEALSLLVDRVRNRGIEFSLCGLNEQVHDLFARTHLQEKVGADHIFPTTSQAVSALHDQAHVGSEESICPLREVCPEVEEAGPGQPIRTRVLLVDDEEELFFTLAERLIMRGMNVDPVTSGDQAVGLARGCKYDVAVVDVKMPGMGDLEVLRELKQLQPALPVILLTGHGAVDEEADGRRNGAYTCLFKPVGIQDLLVAMGQALGGQGHE